MGFIYYLKQLGIINLPLYMIKWINDKPYKSLFLHNDKPGWPSGYGARLLPKETQVSLMFNLPNKKEEKGKDLVSRKRFPSSNLGPGVYTL